MIKIIGPFGRKRVRKSCGKKSMTEQSHRDACDVNNVMRQYGQTGVLPQGSARMGEFIDCSTVDDYKASVDLVMETSAMFSDLPAELRARFANNPIELLAFVADPENTDEAIELGLCEPVEVPIGIEPVDDAPPAPPAVAVPGDATEGV